MEGSNFTRIAKDYHMKRKKPWRPLEFFIEFLENKGYYFRGKILDLGCANGRNFRIMSNPPSKLIGIDISLELLKIANLNLHNIDHYSQEESKFFQLILADMVNLPIRENSIDSIFSIASLHHVKRKTDRNTALFQMYELLKSNGHIILTVWRKWQKRFRDYFLLDWLKRNFTVKYKDQQKVIGLEEFGDKYVPWTLSDKDKVYKRFYHFFSKRELKKLMKTFDVLILKIIGGPTDRDNFFVFASKS